jgi:hypothetical protein
MISDAEQRRLDEIERLLRLEDPGFVRRFDGGPAAPDRVRTPAQVALVVLASILGLLVVGVIAAGLGGPIAAVIAVGALATLGIGVGLAIGLRRRKR